MLWQQALKKFTSNPLFRRKKVYPELVSDETLKQLRSLASRPTPATLDISLEVHQKMLGEKLSPFAKSGFEFAETRPYQVGDNIRFINWRRYASSGELYINTFHEERRPQCWLVVDRRANMRFGTRVRLKAAQAAIYGLYHLFKAQQHQMDVGGVILDEGLTWYDAKSSAEGTQPLIQHIMAPCPPLTEDAGVQFDQALRLLNVRLSPGCLIIMLSDFFSLSDRDTTILSQMRDKHTLAAVQVIDPVEARLPVKGHYHVLDPQHHAVLTLDCNTPSEQQRLTSHLQQRLEEIEQQLKQHGVLFKQVFSDEGAQQEKVLVYQ